MRELFETTVHKLLDGTVTTEAIAKAETGHWPSPLWKAIEETGLGLALSSENHGGVGAQWSDTLPIALAAGAYAVPAPLCETILANWLLSQAGLDSVDGPLTIAARHDLRLSGDLATGTAYDVPFGRFCERMVAVIDGKTPELVLFTTQQSEIGEHRNIAGEARDTIRVAGATIAARAALPPELSVQHVMLGGALMRAAQIAGALGALVDRTVGYANDRSQFGRPIAKFQAIQHQLAVLAEAASMAHAAVERAFALSDMELQAFDVAVAKIITSDAAGKANAIAHAVHGAIGFTYEYSLQFLTRRIWSWRDEFGSEAYWSAALGRQACIDGGEGFWPAITAGTFTGSLDLVDI